MAESSRPSSSSHDEEEDVCRVCRVEGDEADPLIFPCKCSGSVRFVHADCLKNWLLHSRKRYCEICGYKYTFTKVYPDFIPLVIPKHVYLRQAGLWLYRVNCHALRFWAAVIAWLIALPSLNMVTMRGLVWLADLMIQTKPSAPSATDLQHNTTTTNTTLSGGPDDNATAIGNIHREVTFADAILRPVISTGRLLQTQWHKWYFGDADTLPGFVFRGQILCLAVAAILVGLILLREWLTQHNLTEHVAAANVEEVEIRPDEWVIRDGMAHRKCEVVDGAKRQVKAAALRTALSAAVAEAERRDTFQKARPSLSHSDTTAANFRGGYVPGEPTSTEAGHPRPSRRASWPQTTHRARNADTLLPVGSRLPSDPIASALRSPQAPTDVGFPLCDEQGDTLPLYFLNQTAPANSRSHEDLSMIMEPLGIEGRPRPAAPLRSQSDLAYTAPELLGDKGKGKENQPSRMTSSSQVQEDGPSTSSIILPRRSSDPTSTVELESDRFQPDDAPMNGPWLFAGRPEALSMEAIASPVGLGSPTYSPSATSDQTLPPSLIDSPLPSPNLNNRILEPFDGDEDLAGMPHRQMPDVHARRQRPGMREEAAIQDGEEDEIAWEREDWDGVLEVIGLIGPVQNLPQNVTFAQIIMGAAITVLIGIPIMVGKLALSFDLVRSLLRTNQLSLRVMRLVTDPIIDVSGEIINDVIYLPLASSVSALESIVARKAGLRLTSAFTPSTSMSAGKRILLSHVVAAIDATRANDLFGSVGRWTYSSYIYYRTFASQLASSDRLADRIWCMLVGYSVAIWAIAIIAFAGESSLGRISIGVVDQIQQHALFVKLAFFMGIELIVFPLIIGMVVDLSTIPLYDDFGISRQLETLRNMPFSVIFVAWLAGTLFMFSFASFLSHVRTLSRPGALFFIRDPTDQKYSPVKDILERPAGSQMRKLAVSAAMYTVVVVSIFGAVCWGLRLQTLVKVLPIRTTDMYPISSVPFDVLFLHLVIAPSLRLLKPRRRAVRLWNAYWRRATKWFCLAPLLTAKTKQARRATSRGPKIVEMVWPLIDPVCQMIFGKYDPSQTRARVPATDTVALLSPSERQGGVFIPIDELGVPKSDAAKLQLLKQDRKARQMKRNPGEDYTVVSLPRYWRTRIHCFIATGIAIVSTAVAIVAFAPLLVGRAVWRLALSEPVHDGYTWIVGAYICVIVTYWGRIVGRYIVQTGLSKRLRRSAFSTRIKRVLLRALASVWTLTILYWVLPSLLGVLFELYVSHPMTYGKTSEVDVLHFWDAWSIGIIVNSLFVGMMDALVRQGRGRDTRLAKLTEYFRFPLETNFHVLNAAVCPILGWLLIALAVPAILSGVFILSTEWLKISFDNAATIRMAYPCFLYVLLLSLSRRFVRTRWAMLRQKMIDAEYVVEERVENLDPAREGQVIRRGGKQVRDGVSVGALGEVAAENTDELEERDDPHRQDEGEEEETTRTELGSGET